MTIGRAHALPLSATIVAMWLAAGCGAPAEPADAGPVATPASACPVDHPDGATAEDAATCLYDGWIDGDERVIAAYGVEGVTDDLPSVIEDPQLRAEGCTSEGATTGELVCSWSGTNSDGEVALHLVVSGDDDEGFVVTRIDVDR